MRLNTERFGEQQIVLGDIQDSTKFTINMSSEAVVIDSLINLYEDPIGSIVREITSNCVDAHKEKDLKVVGKRPLENDDDPKYFSKRNTVEIEYIERNEVTNNLGSFIFRDFGVGLSEKRVKDIFTVFGSSTKRVDNEEIGGFGLGSKSPFAYTDTFFVRTARNGIEYTYLLSRGSDIPTMDLVNSTPTKKLNMTEIIIPLKEHYHSKDFVSAINQQLKYFPELIFIHVENIAAIQKTEIVFETPDFILDKKENRPGILIGNVEYPLNRGLLDNKTPDCGVKYKFNVGELDLVPSREAIRYTDNTKQKILEKIQKTDEFASKKVFDEINKETEFIKKLYKVITANSKNNYHTYSYSTYSAYNDSQEQEYFNMLCKLSSTAFNVPFEYKELKVPAERVANNWFLKTFNMTLISNSGKSVKRRDVDTISLFDTNNKFYWKTDSDIFTRKKDLYLLKVITTNYKDKIVVLKDKKDVNLGDDDSNSDEIQKEQTLIKQYIKEVLAPKLYKDVPDYNETVARNNYAAIRKANNKIFYRECISSRWNHGGGGWVNKETNILTLDSETTIYGFETDKDDLELIKSFYSSNTIIRIAKTSKKLFVKAMYVGTVLAATNEDFGKAVNNFYFRSVIVNYDHYQYFENIDPYAFNLYIKLAHFGTVYPTNYNGSSSNLDNILNRLNIKKESLVDNKITDAINDLKTYESDLLLFPYISSDLRDLRRYTDQDDFTVALIDYLTLKGKLTIKQEKI